MHVEDIKAALRKQGWTLTSIAKELNIGTSAVSHALTRQRSRRIEQVVEGSALTGSLTWDLSNVRTGVNLPASAFDVTDTSAAERQAFRAEVRDYLLDNPEVILEAVDMLETREAEQQAARDAEMIAANADALFDDGYSWVGGNPEGDITIVEFLDYKCGYCRRAHPIVGELLAADGNIRLIVKEFPILGEESVLASRFALGTLLVEGGEAYKAYTDALMEMRGAMTEEPLAMLAQAMGYDAEAIATRARTEDVAQMITQNRALARTLSINGTPTFIVGDRVLRGFLPFEGMQAVVAEAREG